MASSSSSSSSSSSLFLFLLVLGLPQTIGLLYPRNRLGLPLLHQLPTLLPLPISLQNGLLPFLLLLDLREVPLQIVQFIGHPLQLPLRVALPVGQGEHLLVVGVDQVHQLVVVCLLLILLLGLVFTVLDSLLLKFTLFCIDLGL